MLILFALLLAPLCQCIDFTLIHLSTGDIRGSRLGDYDVTAFYQIPYAKAPIGEKRFTPSALLTEKW